MACLCNDIGKVAEDKENVMPKHKHLPPASQNDTALDKHTSSKSNGAIPTPATARGERTRRRILDAAETVFGELGYYEASVSEITRQAGVAQGTFYIYFHSKREIFVELVEDLGARLRAATRTAMADVPDRLEAERRGFIAFFSSQQITAVSIVLYRKQNVQRQKRHKHTIVVSVVVMYVV